MEIIEMLIDFFGLAPKIVTFTDFAIWFSKVMLAVVIMSVTVKALFTATWKTERMLR